MGYSSDVTDLEGEIIDIIADQEENKTSCVDKEANIERDILST